MYVVLTSELSKRDGLKQLISWHDMGIPIILKLIPHMLTCSPHESLRWTITDSGRRRSSRCWKSSRERSDPSLRASCVVFLRRVAVRSINRDLSWLDGSGSWFSLCTGCKSVHRRSPGREGCWNAERNFALEDG